MRSLSIGLLNLGQARLTLDVVEGLRGFRAAGWRTQLIVVDQGSEDADIRALRGGLAAAADDFDEVDFVEAGENLGAAAGRNVVLARSEGQRILILDNDLVLDGEAGWFEQLWRDLDDDPTLGIVGPTLVFASDPSTVQATGIGLTRLGRVGYLNRGLQVEDVPAEPVRVIASPAACWLMEGSIQREVGLFPEVYYPMQYWDVDYCMQLDAAGYGVLNDRRVTIRHIVNVTTRSMGDRTFARTAVRHGMIFRERWGHRLATLDTIEDADVYWGPVPRS